jgi:hypothetical protein
MYSPTLVAFFNILGGGLIPNVIPHLYIRKNLIIVGLAPTVGKVFFKYRASYVDIVQWAGVLAYVFIFMFMIREFSRARKDWVKVVVRDLQNTVFKV